MPSVRLALVGDYRADAVAHHAIPLAITLAAQSLHLDVSPQWLPTASITDRSQLRDYDAIWLVPGSPYINDDGAFLAISYARENNVPFLGSAAGSSTLSWNMQAMSWAGAMPDMPKLTAVGGW